MNYNQAKKQYDYGNSYSVYVHVFPNGKLYIGSTRQEPKKRWRYGGGYKNTKTIYEPILKYGWENIKHIVLFHNRERYINNCPDRSGENNPMYGKHHSSETKQKIREAHLGKPLNLSVEQRKRRSERVSKPVYKLDKEGNILCKYNSIKEASIDVNAKATNIGLCCREKNRTAKGFMWRYANEID